MMEWRKQIKKSFVSCWKTSGKKQKSNFLKEKINKEYKRLKKTIVKWIVFSGRFLYAF